MGIELVLAIIGQQYVAVELVLPTGRSVALAQEVVELVGFFGPSPKGAPKIDAIQSSSLSCYLGSPFVILPAK